MNKYDIVKIDGYGDTVFIIMDIPDHDPTMLYVASGSVRLWICDWQVV